MNNIDKSFQKSGRDPVLFATQYFEYLAHIFKEIDVQSVGKFINLFLSTRDNGGRIYFIGNGGSAATASHFANDFSVGTKTLTKPFRAFSLSDNLAAITAVGNDFGYEEIFFRQLVNCDLSGNDVVVAISASGNSPNIIKAIEFANSKGATTVGLTGFDGGKLMKLAKLNVHVPSEKGEYGPVEDVHMVFDHVAHAFITSLLRADGEIA